MPVAWKDGGSEPFVWCTDGAGTWCAVWERPHGFSAWVSSLAWSQITAHTTEADAKAWCEASIGEKQNP